MDMKNGPHPNPAEGNKEVQDSDIVSKSRLNKYGKKIQDPQLKAANNRNSNSAGDSPKTTANGAATVSRENNDAAKSKHTAIYMES